MSRSTPASEVIAQGAAAVKAAVKPILPPVLGCGVKIPIEVTSDQRLVNTQTGEVLGRCSSPEVAARTQHFFA
jgi:hypothetical protein